MYTDDLKAPVVLSRSEVARQRAVAAYAKSVGYGEWISSDAHSSTASSTDVRSSDVPVSDVQSDDGSQTSYRTSRNPFNVSSDTGGSASTARFGTPVNSDNEDQEEMSEDQKRLMRRAQKKASTKTPPRPETPTESAPPRPTASSGKVPPRAATPKSVPPDPPSPESPKKKGAGKKAAVATPLARPAESETTHQMTTRQRASRA
jgi:hypothetical protein